ncbi:choice-of-anchor M domain-containing protein [Corynebacterium pseudodiphtheriticum]|uniref:choice-of-anchor M domain-containing protein n=1 Tax=Corynebacterium pseudodiphtheriticum TaxID=37637 RepID=UPI002542A31A|nr:choice-of-anchor M domain-containing protein [Corynebacterium pseudodiphtheriticum]MDK4283664.1 choice-of-anchor M domain-containing protein [Corynebacterium pseudodiphtheriticum]
MVPQLRRSRATGRRSSNIRLAVAVTAALSTTFVGLPAATAGPDDGKKILTKEHIDAPYTVRDEAGVFDLYAHNNEGAHKFSESAVWIGKGYNSDGADKKQQYQFTVTDNERLSYLGTPGDTYVYSPETPLGGRQDPAWLGYGAEKDLNVDDMLNGRVSLDLLSVDGPGEVEQLQYRSGQAIDVLRLLGTSASSPRSISIEPGEHNHIGTVFTKPGRYELKFQTSGLRKDGTYVASEPRTMVIQAGGQQPKSEATKPLQERYNQTRTANLAEANYRLSVAKKADPTVDGDDKLSTISFDAGNPELSGTVTLFVDGYFLTDLEVENGKASWDELLSAQESNIQAVFTPDDETSAHWISAPLAYSAGQAGVETTSENHAEQLPKGNNLRTFNFPAPNTAVTNDEVTVKYVPGANGVGEIVVEAKDPKLQGLITGGIYENEGWLEKGTADRELAGTFQDGKGTLRFGEEYLPDNALLKIDVIPHAGFGRKAASGIVTDKFNVGTSAEATFRLGEIDGSLEPELQRPGQGDSGTDNSGAQNPGAEQQEPPKNNEQQGSDEQAGHPVCEDKILLNRGHVDILGKRTKDGLDIALKDDTRLAADKSVERSLEDVAFVIRDNAKRKRPEQLSDEKYNFIGEKGSEFYYLPQAQDKAVLWPGYNTEAIPVQDEFDGAVSLNLVPRETPENSSWGVFIDKGSFGGDHEILADSTKQDYSIESHYSAHTHVHWAFSHPGIYTFDASYSGKTKDGTELKSDSHELVVTVGEEALETCKTAPAPKPDQPDQPAQPNQPSNPNQPSKPNLPSQPGTPGKPETPEKPEKPGAPESGKKPESPKDPDKQSTPGSSSPKGFFSNFNPVHLLAPVLGIVFIARMVALLTELQPQIAHFFTSKMPNFPGK